MKIELIQNSHLEKLISFLVNFEDETRGKKFWKDRINNWWKNNPSVNPNFKKGWVLVNESESIVGFIGNIPTHFIINGEIKIVNNATTWRVLKEYRSYSILLLQEVIKSSSSTILFDTSPTIEVEKVLNHFKFSKLDVNKATVVPINITEDTTNKYIIKLKPFIPLVNSFLFIFNKVFFSYPKEFESKIISVNEISSDFDDLWNQTRQIYSNTLLRNSKTIKWYLNYQVSKKILICCFKEKKIIGYGIFIIDNDNMRMIDFWSGSMNFDILRSIATRAFYFCKKNKMKSLIFIHFNNHIKYFLEKLYPNQSSYDTRLYFKTKICDFDSHDTYSTLITGDIGL